MKAVAFTLESQRKGVNKNMQIHNQMTSGGEPENKKSQLLKASHVNHANGSSFDPMKYMLKIPKTKKVKLSNGQVRFEQTEVDYLPVAARIA